VSGREGAWGCWRERELVTGERGEEAGDRALCSLAIYFTLVALGINFIKNAYTISKPKGAVLINKSA
jgi:hypothetical protein